MGSATLRRGLTRRFHLARETNRTFQDLVFSSTFPMSFLVLHGLAAQTNIAATAPCSPTRLRRRWSAASTSNTVEAPEEAAATIRAALAHAPAERLYPGANCGMAPMAGPIAYAKLKALAAGAETARKAM